MYRHFTSEFFAGNRARLRGLFTGTAPIVVTANAVMQRNNDVTYPFRQDSSFWYLTGLQHPDLILVLDRDKEYLIEPERNAAKVTFDGQLDFEELKQVSAIGNVYGAEEGWRLLEKRLKKAKHVATLAAPKEFDSTWGYYNNPARARLIEQIKVTNPQIKLLDLRTHLARLRVIKQPAELATIKQAIAITSKAIKYVQKHKYNFEYEVEAALTGQFRKAGASGHGFAPIVAAGAKACVLHNIDNNGPLDPADLLTVDVGAEVDNYSADITRTYSIGGSPSKRQRDVYAASLAVHEFATNLVKPGALMRDNEQQIEQFMGEKLRELGLIKTISHETVRQFYPHATSHFLGLDVHDTGDYSQPLAKGMVITIEPGIYIPKEGIGVRIEDDVLVTSHGYKNLSASLPRSLA